MMYENVNGIMVPDGTTMLDTYHAVHYGTIETVTEILGEYGPIKAKPCLEPIDDDPTIEIVLASYGL